MPRKKKNKIVEEFIGAPMGEKHLKPPKSKTMPKIEINTESKNIERESNIKFF